MLKNLTKYFKPEEEKVEMTTETNAAAPAAVEMTAELTAQVAELQASFAQVSEALATKETALAEMAAKLEQAEAALATVAAEKEAVEAAAKQAVKDARMSKLVEAVGDVQASALMTATEGMEDAAFEKIVAALTVNIDKEANSEMFNETGVDAQPKAAEEEKPMDFKQFINKA